MKRKRLHIPLPASASSNQKLHTVFLVIEDLSRLLHEAESH